MLHSLMMFNLLLAIQYNALGHVTTYTAYDANGKLLSLTDPNSLPISLAYDPRGRLTQKKVDGNITAYNYDAVGNLLKVTQPTGVNIRYTYDAAHRLTDITDGLGGKIHYTLDAMGNRIKEDIIDALGTKAANTMLCLGCNRTSALIIKPQTFSTTPTAT